MATRIRGEQRTPGIGSRSLGSLRNWLLVLFFVLPLLGMGLQSASVEGQAEPDAGALWADFRELDGPFTAAALAGPGGGVSRDATGDSAAILAVSWDGGFVGVDPVTGAGGLIGPTGFFGLDSLAEDSSGTLYTAVADTELLTLDPVTGAGTPGAPIGLDVRGLAFSAADVLYAIADLGPASTDQLFTLDPDTGQAILVGLTGFTSIEGLDFAADGTLYAWDTVDGLLTVDPGAGTAVDVNGAIGGNPDVQSLLFMPDGTLFGGARPGLFEIDPVTGAFAFIGNSGFDIRGMEVNRAFLFADGFESGDVSAWSNAVP